MPKTKGMTSLEIAVIVAIVLVIAVAVGWYVYTTFVASTTGQPRLNIVSAEMYGRGLVLTVINPGPVDVQIDSIEIAGVRVDKNIYIYIGDKWMTHDSGVIGVGQQGEIWVYFPNDLSLGTMVYGRVILRGGQSFPFTAVVR